MLHRCGLFDNHRVGRAVFPLPRNLAAFLGIEPRFPSPTDGVLVIRRSGDIGGAGQDRTDVLPVMSRALEPTQLQHLNRCRRLSYSTIVLLVATKSNEFVEFGSPDGFRTRFSALKGRRPSPSSPRGHVLECVVRFELTFPQSRCPSILDDNQIPCGVSAVGIEPTFPASRRPAFRRDAQ